MPWKITTSHAFCLQLGTTITHLLIYKFFFNTWNRRFNIITIWESGQNIDSRFIRWRRKSEKSTLFPNVFLTTIFNNHSDKLSRWDVIIETPFLIVYTWIQHWFGILIQWGKSRYCLRSYLVARWFVLLILLHLRANLPRWIRSCGHINRMTRRLMAIKQS